MKQPTKHGISMLLSLVLVSLICVIPVQVGGALDTSSLLNGVKTIHSYGIGGANGVPGPLETLNSAPTTLPFMSAEDNLPKDVATGSSYGSGRVVALGHDGFFINEAINNANNRQFGNNIINWLNAGSRKKKVLVSTGHGEPWVGSGSYSSFYNGLSGYTFTTHTGPITSQALSDVSVLLISCAGSDFSSMEINTIKNFVSNGGGLLIQGLGWAWVGYHPDSTLNGYPMNKVAAPFGIRFLSGYLYHTFYVSQEPENRPFPPHESVEITKIEFYTNNRLIASFTDQTLKTVRVNKGDSVKVKAFGTYQGPDYAILSLTEGRSIQSVKNVAPSTERVVCISFTANVDTHISVVIHDHPDWEVEDVRSFTIDVR